MDISELLAHYEHITRFDSVVSGLGLGVSILLVFAAIGVGYFVVFHLGGLLRNKVLGVDKNSWDGSRWPVMTVVGAAFLAVVLGVFSAGLAGFMAVWPYGTPKEKEAQFISQVAEDANAYYGVDIDSGDYRDALELGDSEVHLVGGVHDGVRKSLGIQVDEEDGFVIIYQGNVELEPVK